MKKIALGCFLLFSLNHCGGGDRLEYVGFQIDLPASAETLPIDSLTLKAQVWALSANEDESLILLDNASMAERTLRGNFALPVLNLQRNREYELRLELLYKAKEFITPSLSSENDVISINQDLNNFCPQLSLTPDASLLSLKAEQWLVLCSHTVRVVFDPKILHEIIAEDLTCNLVDADGDGINNLAELSTSLNPFTGDIDGDCVTDLEDAFPTDLSESRDLDGDGLGDRADLDADGDGLSNEAETSSGLNPLNNDTDGDSFGDAPDNCPVLTNATQEDIDQDGIGDVCDDDRDSDGLSDTEETSLGTNPRSADSDGDGLSDKNEVDTRTNPLKADSDGDGFSDSNDTFPVDGRVHQDTDNDGIGDGLDLCAGLNNADDNADLDGDALANPCDSDDDGDGVTDLIEADIGLNGRSVDSDNDGLTDWWGGNISANMDACPLIALNETNSAEHNTDNDNDGFGSLCDCDETKSEVNPAQTDLPDVAGLDADCDGIDGQVRRAVFVSATGSDKNTGAPDSPLKTIAVAVASAQSKNLGQIYLAEGDYTLNNILSVAEDLAFYGGYSADFTVRSGQGTVLASALTTSISHLDQELILDGLEIEIDGSTNSFVTFMESSGGTVVFTNSVLSLAGNKDVKAFVLADTEITLDNATFDLNSASRQITAIELDQTTGSIQNTVLQLADAQIKMALRCKKAGATDLVLNNITFDLWAGLALEDVNAVYIQDCSQSPDGFHYAVPLAGSAVYEGFEFNLNNIIDGLY